MGKNNIQHKINKYKSIVFVLSYNNGFKYSFFCI